MHRKAIAAFFLVFLTLLLPAAAAERSVALIIDSSGSMKAQLANGQARSDAAKDAVETLVSGLPDELRLTLWAYGHQSPTKEKNCQDIQQLTSFDTIDTNRQDVVRLTRSLKPQGYTPITQVLQRAANSLKAETAASSRVVILVSDGKETCEGDPCAVARALAAADADLVVHTIGFAVDVAARYQLQCIAREGRGTYFEADSTPKLAEQLTTAVRTVAVAIPAGVETASAKPGRLRLTNPSASSHEVINVETGEVATKLSAVRSSVELPAGFYNVRFGNQLWRSIEVKNGEVTEISTAILELPSASYRGHEIRDWETGEVIGKLSSSRSSMNLLPSSYELAFGTKSVAITLEPDKRTTFDAASVTFKGLPINGRTIFDEAGNAVIEVSATAASTTLPPGKYLLDLQSTKVPFEVKAGESLSITIN